MMEKEQEEMKSLGLLGIYTESFKLIFKCRKIFTKITLSLILPLSLIFLTREGIPLLHTNVNTENPNFSNLKSSEWGLTLLFNALYFTFLLLFSLLPTSAVIYTVARTYTSGETSFKAVMSVLPRVWKRLMITFLCTLLGFITYITLFALIIFLWLKFIGSTRVGPIALVVILVSYPVGFIYMIIIWQLANVVTVLEDISGFKAMKKSKNLIKGKIIVSIVILFMLSFSQTLINNYFRVNFVNCWEQIGILKIVGIGGLCLFVLVNLNLFALVVQTVVYFVCKAYHNENVDKSSLSAYILEDYVPLKLAKDVQLEFYDDV